MFVVFFKSHIHRILIREVKTRSKGISTCVCTPLVAVTVSYSDRGPGHAGPRSVHSAHAVSKDPAMAEPQLPHAEDVLIRQ